MIKRTISTLAVVGLLALTGCGDDDTTTAEGSPGSDGDTTQLTVALPVDICLATWPFHVADREGLFAQEGIEISLQGLDGSSSAIQATLAGRAQMAVTAPADLLAAAGAGADVTAWYSVYQELPFALVTLADSGITEIAELEGATIGISSPGGGDAIFMRSLLAEAGLAEDSFDELSVGEGQAAATALSGGTVDAYSASFVEQLIFGGMGIEYTELESDTYPEVAGLVIMTGTEWFQANPDLAVGIGRALATATERGLADRQLVLDTCTAVAPDETEDPGFATVVLDAVDALYTLGDAAEGRYGYIDEEAWVDYRALLVDLAIVESAAADAPASNVHVDAWNGD